MIEGTIVKALSGFYYVETDQGIFSCKARGIFKKQGVTPYVGDDVIVTLLDDEDGVIDEILPRKNDFIRPPIANVEQFLIVVAADHPKPNTEIIDKFLVTAESASVKPILCINKIDLPDVVATVDELRRVYGELYKVIEISSKTKEGFEVFKSILKGKKTAFVGPSGVGKSTILNELAENIDQEVGDVSRKTKRGKHTTRHVEIFKTDFGAEIFDTPGFTSFDSVKSDDIDLDLLYPEFAEKKGTCKFQNCKHLNEPGCAIIDAVKTGEIPESRYESYKKQMEENND